VGQKPIDLCMMIEVPSSGDFRKLADLIKDVRVAMMHTSLDDLGAGGMTRPQVRPMYTQRLDPASFRGELWFFTDASSRKVSEIADNSAIMLTYAAPDKNVYAAAFGTATCERNEQEARELWNIHAKGWWPEGPASPSLMLIRVQVQTAEYWEGPSSTSYMLSLLKAVALGQRVAPGGSHGRVIA
jgi:general stress protein 26